MQINTPVLFLIFNRPHSTAQVFEAIKNAQPRKLYIAADGPRVEMLNDEILCGQVRQFVISQIDWECEVNTLFREKNLGCRIAVSEAITWFFNNEEQGIILEDDCLPNKSFFEYCELLLNRYHDDPRVTMISGSNHLFDKNYSKIDGYFSSTYCNIWGWATWRRVINQVDWYPQKINLRIDEQDFSNYLLNKNRLANSFRNLLFDVIDNKFNTWDIILFYNIYKLNGVNIFPVKNLISNIGLDGTHANGNKKDITIFRHSYTMEITKLNALSELMDVHNSFNRSMMMNIENIVAPKPRLLDMIRTGLLFSRIKNIFRL